MIVKKTTIEKLYVKLIVNLCEIIKIASFDKGDVPNGGQEAMVEKWTINDCEPISSSGLYLQGNKFRNSCRPQIVHIAVHIHFRSMCYKLKEYWKENA
ncbi:hypothetical protein BLOT_013918 [Blomia tropicalis]|nr:hypothetical protein BLOT_013918 [Blomia tropicalis]